MSMSFYIATVYLEHYDNLPNACNIQRNFLAVKFENFIGKNFGIFNIFAQRIDCGRVKKHLGKAVIKSTHNPCLGSEIRKLYTPVLLHKIGFRRGIQTILFMDMFS